MKYHINRLAHRTMHLPILTIFVLAGISDLLHTKNMAEIGVGLGAMCMEYFCRTEYWFTGVELQPKSLYYQIDFLSRDRFPHSKQQYEAWDQGTLSIEEEVGPDPTMPWESEATLSQDVVEAELGKMVDDKEHELVVRARPT